MKKLPIDYLGALGSTVGDVHFPKVKWLSAFDGSNGATTTTDSSDSNSSLTLQGSTQISTAQSKFGGSSMYVPNSAQQGVYANVAGTTVNLTGDFTLEWWVYRVQVSMANSMAQLIYGLPLADDLTSYGMVIGYYGSSASTTQGLMYCSSNGSSWNVASAVQLGTGSLGTVGQWVHMAMVRSGSDWSYYVDGTRTYTGSLGSATISTPGSYMYLGRAWGDVSSMEAYYDDFRVTQGLARYTGASFTVPTTAHLTSAGDVNKQIVINSDADGVAIGTGGINQARIAKAWVNFDGTGTPGIRESYNVSSITDTATGRYTINFSTALSNANFCFAGTAGHNAGTTGSGRDIQNDGTRTTTSLPIRVTWATDTAYDDTYVGIMVFGN
tara:strand:- start:2150 stop:3298 length:1149 start_codon:yes stop_codon:yes gene_type:complete